jgi:hypothetical protein
MSALMECSTTEERQSILSQLFSDPTWSPSSYRFLNDSLVVVAVVNTCTVLDLEDALECLSSTPGAVYIAEMDNDRRNMKMLPWRYNAETGQIEQFGRQDA